MIFKNAVFLLFSPVVIAIFYYLYKKGERGAHLRFSSSELLLPLKESLKLKLSRRIIFLRAAALTLILFALARPQSPIHETEVTAEGIDIVLAIDVSTSMRAEDFTLHGQRQNRLEVVKEVVTDFVKGRYSDRIGAVVFAARTYTVCPLTLDYNWLLSNLDRINVGMVEDGTAIGSGISVALNRLKDTEAKSKVIILLTDGMNNAGKISPLTAAEAARSLNVKIYTIGAGSDGTVPFPFRDAYGGIVYRPVKIQVDEAVLREIADITGGRYFRAENTRALREIYREIDKLEKIPIKERGYVEYKELFYIFLVPGIALLFIELFLSSTLFRKLP